MIVRGFTGSKALLAVTLMTGLLVGTVFVLTYNTDSAAIAPSSIADKTLKEKSIMKIKNFVDKDKRSENANLEVKGSVEGSSVSFNVLNRGIVPSVIKIDKWEARLFGDRWAAPSEIIETDVNVVIPAVGSLPITTIDISKYDDVFEVFPGTYTLELIGWKWGEKQLEDCEEGVCRSHTKVGNFEEYLLRTEITVDYDTDNIKSNLGLLKSHGMKIEATDNTFKINDSPKKIGFYAVNDKNHKISGLVTGWKLSIWHSEHRAEGIGISMVADFVDNYCESVNPGQGKLLQEYEFSKSKSLLGENGIASKLGSKSAVPGVYIIHMQATTAPCVMNDGVQVPGLETDMIAAIEVLP